jgi:hypothetical protein
MLKSYSHFEHFVQTGSTGLETGLLIFINFSQHLPIVPIHTHKAKLCITNLLWSMTRARPCLCDARPWQLGKAG